jgi:hypothetical protein
MSSIAILLFAVPFEEILILQLGHDDFQKRQVATSYLNNVLQDTDGCRNYSILLAVKKASEDKDKNPELRIRARRLYQDNYTRYFREYPYLLVYFNKDELGVVRDKEFAARIGVIMHGYRPTGRKGISVRYGLMNVYAMPEDFNSDKLNRLKMRKEVAGIVAFFYQDRLPWPPPSAIFPTRAIHSLHVRFLG